MRPVDELLAAGRSGAAHVESGRFRLDWKKALDKIKEFQLVDPHRWVLEIVQGAVAGGASAVAVTLDSDDVVIAFDGTTPDAQQLETLFDFLFASEIELTPLRQLALGVNSVLAMKPRFVRVDVGDGAVGHRLELSGYDDMIVRPLTEEVPSGVRVHVRERSGWRRVFDDLWYDRSAKGKYSEKPGLELSGVRVPPTEGEILAAECRWCPIPITLDGKRLDGGIEASLVSHRFAVEGVRGILALQAPSGAAALGRLAICMNGVHIVDHRFEPGSPLDQLGLFGVIDDPSLRRTASHSGIHPDARWHALLDRVTAEVPALIDLLCRALADGSVPDAPEIMLIGAARLVLRGVTGDLPAGREILLDRLHAVELATSRPTHCSLRAPWEDVRRSGRLAVATSRRELPLDILGGMVPVLGPRWVIELLGPAVQNVDERLRRMERAATGRMRREALRRRPELSPEEAFLRVPLSDPNGRIRGELGLDEHLSRSLQDLGSADTEFARARGVYVVYCREGVPLGVRWLDTDLWRGAAVVDSPDFEHDPMSKDVIPGPATAAADELIAAAVPAVAHALWEAFETLPPPEALFEVGVWTEEAIRYGLPESLAGTADPHADAARRHIEAILQARRFDLEASPWLWGWKLFHLVDGTTVSLEQIDGRAPVAGEIVPSDRWRLAQAQPWGQGAPADLRILNVTPAQRDILRRQLGRSIADGTSILQRERAVPRRAQNLARAARHRQTAVLAPDDFELIVDLEVPGVRGQVGLLRRNRTPLIRFALGDVEDPPAYDPSSIRILVDDLPLVDLPLNAPIPVRAVVESPALSADAAFTGLADPEMKRVVTGWVRRSFPLLMARFAVTTAAHEPHGHALVWNWLESLSPEQIDRIPEPVLDLALVPACGGGRLSLRAIRQDAAANQHTVRVVAIDPGRVPPGRPILICNAGQRTVLHRVLPARVADFNRDLQRQLDHLDRMRVATREPRLEEELLARAPLRAEGYRGEVGVTTSESGWVEVMLGDAPVQRRPLDIDGLPLIGVVSSNRFTPNTEWTKIRSNEAWMEAVRALRDAADRLVIDACAVATGPTAAASPLRAMLRALCGRRFAGRRNAIAAPEPGVDASLAAAPIWDTADAEPRRVSLADIAAHVRQSGSIGVVGDGTGRGAGDRMLLRCAEPDRKALAAIWRDRVLDGADPVPRDDAGRHEPGAPGPVADALPPVDVDAHLPQAGRAIASGPEAMRSAPDPQISDDDDGSRAEPDGARSEAAKMREPHTSEPVADTVHPSRASAHDTDRMREVFLSRAPMASVDLDAIDAGERWLLRRPIIGDLWKGELGIPATPGRGLTVHVYVERRLLTVRRIEAPIRAMAALQWTASGMEGPSDESADAQELTRLDRQMRAEAWRAHTALSADIAGFEGTAFAQARTVLMAALVLAPTEGDAELRAAVDALRGAPLFEDTRGKRWSVAALTDHAGGGRLRAIWPATFQEHSAPIDDLVLVIDRADWPLATRLLPVIRDDQHWIEECAGYLNRQLAVTTHAIPRGALAVADVQAGDLRGRLALSQTAGPGHVGLLSGGRKVEVRELPDMPGLVGWVDGPLPTNRRFRKVRMESTHFELLERWYDERLAAAVELAHAHQWHGDGTWYALSWYARAYLSRHLEALGGSVHRRRDRIIPPEESLPEPLRRALACPVFQKGDGDWVSVSALLSAGKPRIVVGKGGEDDLPPGAVLLRGSATELVPLLAGLVGSHSVQDADQARSMAGLERRRAEEDAREVVQHRQGAVLGAVRGLLSELSDGGSRQHDWVRRLSLHRSGRGAPLLDLHLLNSEHPLFEAACAARMDKVDGAIALLALALIDIAAPPKEAPALVLRLAERLLRSLGQRGAT